MARLTLLFLLALMSLLSPVRAAPAPADQPGDTADRIAPNDPAWSDLAAAFARNPDATADFSEQRFFPFKKAPLDLKGQVRVSRQRGLSLHYTAPEERTVVIDDQGMLMRERGGQESAPPDPRAAPVNAALVQVLHFDLAALATNFEIRGRRDGPTWLLTLLPRAADLRRAVGEIAVAGETTAVQRITIRRTAKQYIEILIGPPRPAPFTSDEVKRFFR